tara:strand:+ start:401 stop:613 length:213 start_codon:yes stop_codon:yes gene_type:complete
MLSKQSIRGTTQIYMNKKLITDKEVIISESESWTEEETVFFKKMIRQGGTFSISGRKYFIVPNANNQSLI